MLSAVMIVIIIGNQMRFTMNYSFLIKLISYNSKIKILNAFLFENSWF